MTHYASTFKVHLHDGQCYLSIRSTENRVDTFIFSKRDLEPMIGMSQENEWIGSKKVSIKINTQKSKATIKIDKGHSIVAYSSEIHEIQKLLAQIEDIYFKLQAGIEDTEDVHVEQEPQELSTNLLQAINAMMLRHNQILLHEITLKLKKIQSHTTVSIPAKEADPMTMMRETQTFIPSNIGTSLVGKIQTKDQDTTVNATELAQQLKNIKDTQNE